MDIETYEKLRIYVSYRAEMYPLETFSTLSILFTIISFHIKNALLSSHPIMILLYANYMIVLCKLFTFHFFYTHSIIYKWFKWIDLYSMNIRLEKTFKLIQNERNWLSHQFQCGNVSPGNFVQLYQTRADRHTAFCARSISHQG